MSGTNANVMHAAASALLGTLLGEAARRAGEAEIDSEILETGLEAMSEILDEHGETLADIPLDALMRLLGRTESAHGFNAMLASIGDDQLAASAEANVEELRRLKAGVAARRSLVASLAGKGMTVAQAVLGATLSSRLHGQHE